MATRPTDGRNHAAFSRGSVAVTAARPAHLYGVNVPATSLELHERDIYIE